jgi:hypothetical protein
MQVLVARGGMRAEEKGGMGAEEQGRWGGEADIGMKMLRRLRGGRDCSRRKPRQMI